MKLLRKSLSILLIFATLFTSFFPYSVSAADISQGASKGDLRLGTYDSSKKNKIEIIKKDSNNVQVKKVVTKKSVGTYNVEFFVKGPKMQVSTTTTLPVYVVFVIDRSNSMSNDSRWSNAETAAINISKEFSKLGVNMAAVAFSGGRTRSEANGGDQTAYNDIKLINEGKFSKNPITDFGSYDSDTEHGGGTNMYAGLQKANELLSGKDGVKHIILLTDGVPTFYYDANGYTKGPGNSNNDDKIEQVPNVISITEDMAEKVKANGITIHTIGYHLNKLTYVHSSNKNLNERNLAIQTLQSISSSSSTYHLVDYNSSTNVSIELGNIKEGIMNLNVANDPIIEDGIGNKFKLSSASKYGGTKKLSKSNYGVENSWTSLGNFDITIDTTVPTGWYNTNANFTFIYTHPTKGKQTFTYTDNPQVYWTQPANWTIKHVEKGNTSNVLQTENGSAELKDVIPVNKKTFTGYSYDSQDKQSIVIDTENNIAYVYYTKNSYNYTIYHVEKNNPTNVLATESNSALYKANIPVNKKTFDGYSYDSQDKTNIVIDTTNNIAYVYYTRNNYSYTIIHQEKNNPANIFETINNTAKYQEVIKVNKKDFTGYSYDSQDKENIVINKSNNIAYVYYTKNSYDYTIYHVEKNNPTNVLDVESDRALYKENILVNKKTFTGYSYDSQDKTNIVINTTNNVAYVYYTRNNYDYTIYHVERENPNNILDIESDSALYQENISVNDKEFEGYSYDSQDKDFIVINTTNNIAYVYYTRNVYSYTVEHYKENLDGDFELVVEDTVVNENSKYGEETTFVVNEYPGYNYDEDLTENAGVLQPANNDLVIRLYYKLGDGEAIIHYVVKVGDNYIPFDEYAIDENGNVIPDFTDVDLTTSMLSGKIGTEFATEYRVVSGYNFIGLYNGNILENNDIEKIDANTVISTFGVDKQEYTYVYELPEAIGDEGGLIPPHTDDATSFIVSYNNIAIIEDKKKRKNK